MREPPTKGGLYFPVWAKLTMRDCRAVHPEVMTAEAKMLTSEEFASLLSVGNTSAVTRPPAVIPAEHCVRLIALGYMVDLEGRLRVTTPGRFRIYMPGDSPTEAASLRFSGGSHASFDEWPGSAAIFRPIMLSWSGRVACLSRTTELLDWLLCRRWP